MAAHRQLARRELPRGFTIRDRNYISARWPGDCQRLAIEVRDMVLETRSEHPSR
ncbi:hypothetical protein [Nocardia brasiliensis]|uniref:hypothetical protein n=1 Tax=Nocardia brasiliensis TaxID=37326 RepID=UPI0033C491E9